jgi:uncharacterized membrane protein
MMWHYAPHLWIWMFPVMMLIFWGAIIALVVVLVRSFTHHESRDDAALAILRRRLAAGEITPEDFEKTRKLLQP